MSRHLSGRVIVLRVGVRAGGGGEGGRPWLVVN